MTKANLRTVHMALGAVTPTDAFWNPGDLIVDDALGQIAQIGLAGGVKYLRPDPVALVQSIGASGINGASGVFNITGPAFLPVFVDLDCFLGAMTALAANKESFSSFIATHGTVIGNLGAAGTLQVVFDGAANTTVNAVVSSPGQVAALAQAHII